MENEQRILFDAVAQSAERTPEAVAWEFFGASCTYRDFTRRILRAAAALTAIGIREGDVVCIAMPNMPQAITLFYAVNRIGAVANMIHPLSGPQEVREYVQRVRARCILVMDQFYGSLRDVLPEEAQVIVASAGEEMPLPGRLAYWLTKGCKLPKPAGRALSWNAFTALGTNPPSLPEITRHPGKTAVILHSGGTSGRVKGVCLSNENIIAAAQQMIACNPMICGGDRFLSVMPIFHGNGLVIGIHCMMQVGARCVLIPRFTPESYARNLLRHRCNYLSGVPALFEKMIATPVMQNADLSFLKGVFSGADALPVELERRINTFLSAHHCPVRVRQGYGMTEGVVATSLNPAEQQREGSIGKPLPGVRMKIVEPGTERELPVGETGEIVFSSVTNMLGYFENPEETASTLRTHADGESWIHSGDLGCVDADGYYYYKGRSKRMIITNGYNVFPLELENILERCEAVDRCCVIGVPDPRRGQRVKAFVVLRSGAAADEETKRRLTDHCRQFAPAYAIPRDIVFLTDLPRTRVGKVDYKELERRDAAQEGHT